jgi:hypothetical protein
LASGALAKEAEPAGPLGDEQVAVRQPRHAPRMRQRLRDDDDADLVLFGGVEDDRTGGQRHFRDAHREASASSALLRRDRGHEARQHEKDEGNSLHVREYNPPVQGDCRCETESGGLVLS